MTKETQHTPGPWVLDKTHCNSDVIEIIANGAPIIRVSYDMYEEGDFNHKTKEKPTPT